MTRQNRISRCPQRLGGRPSPGLDKGQEIRKALGTKDPACHAYFQAAPPWGQYPLGRQKVPDAVPAGGSSGLPTNGTGASCTPQSGSTTVLLCNLEESCCERGTKVKQTTLSRQFLPEAQQRVEKLPSPSCPRVPKRRVLYSAGCQHPGQDTAPSACLVTLPRWTIAEQGQTEHQAVKVRFGPCVSPGPSRAGVS